MRNLNSWKRTHQVPRSSHPYRWPSESEIARVRCRAFGNMDWHLKVWYHRGSCESSRAPMWVGCRISPISKLKSANSGCIMLLPVRFIYFDQLTHLADAISHIHDDTSFEQIFRCWTSLKLLRISATYKHIFALLQLSILSMLSSTTRLTSPSGNGPPLHSFGSVTISFNGMFVHPMSRLMSNDFSPSSPSLSISTISYVSETWTKSFLQPLSSTLSTRQGSRRSRSIAHQAGPSLCTKLGRKCAGRERPTRMPSPRFPKGPLAWWAIFRYRPTSTNSCQDRGSVWWSPAGSALHRETAFVSTMRRRYVDTCGRSTRAKPCPSIACWRRTSRAQSCQSPYLTARYRSRCWWSLIDDV